MSSKRINPIKWLIKGGLVLFYFLSLIIPVQAKAPLANKTVTLQGKVLDSIAGRAIPKAKVSTYSVSTSTDSKGNYRLVLPLNSKRKIPLRIEAAGYQRQNQTLQVKPANTYKLNFKLVSGVPAAKTILSISLDSVYWNIGSTNTNKIVTMTGKNKIIVSNNGNVSEAFELKLINPAGWTAANNPDKEAYVLSGLFCGLNDLPEDIHFNQTAAFEDVITTQAKKATQSIFSYAQSISNGINVPSGGKRTLYLQFKSPTVTQRKEQQNISVIVSCQTY